MYIWKKGGDNAEERGEVMRCTVMRGKEGSEFESGGDDGDACNSIIGGSDALWLPAAEDCELVATDQAKLKTFGPLPTLLKI